MVDPCQQIQKEIIFLFVRLRVCLSACLPVCLSVCLSVSFYLSLFLCLYLSQCLIIEYFDSYLLHSSFPFFVKFQMMRYFY